MEDHLAAGTFVRLQQRQTFGAETVLHRAGDFLHALDELSQLVGIGVEKGTRREFRDDEVWPSMRGMMSRKARAISSS